MLLGHWPLVRRWEPCWERNGCDGSVGSRTFPRFWNVWDAGLWDEIGWDEIGWCIMCGLSRSLTVATMEVGVW